MLVALYVRVSTNRQVIEGMSIHDQIEQMNNWAKNNQHNVVQEFIELGASAYDDKRPVFDEMIEAALKWPSPFNAIIVHSVTRFCRDNAIRELIERKLAKDEVRVISITEPLPEDEAAANLMRNVVGITGEWQSRENAKHAMRCQRDNAIQGYYNGAPTPFGYKAIVTDVAGSRGRLKKKLAINEAEAGIVRMAYVFYLQGLEAREMGCKEIAKHFNEKGLLMRGKPWRMQKAQTVLSDPLYMGEYFTNIRDSKNNCNRPPDEWVKVSVPAIIDAATFERVREKREARSPSRTPPRVTNSPTLLTSLLKCGNQACSSHQGQLCGTG